MTRETDADKAIREAAEEIRRESKAAAAEVRIELGVAGRETRDALRDAMHEMRAALAEAWGPPPARSAPDAATRPSRAERKEMTRELLLDAAIEVFARKGYHGASLDDVAEAAGFTKGAVYSNFTRKSDLFRALMERETQRGSAALRRTIEAVPLEMLPDVAGELLRRPEAEQRDWDVLRMEFWLAAARDPSLRAMLLDARNDLGEVIDAKLAASDVRPGLTGPELAVILDALTTGLLMNQTIDPEGDQPTLYAKAVHKLISDEPTSASSDDPETS